MTICKGYQEIEVKDSAEPPWIFGLSRFLMSKLADAPIPTEIAERIPTLIVNTVARQASCSEFFV